MAARRSPQRSRLQWEMNPGYMEASFHRGNRSRRENARGQNASREEEISPGSGNPTSCRSVRGQRNRRLAENVTPSRRRAHVRIAEPQLALEGLSLRRPFHVQERGHDCGIAIDADLLLAVVLTFVDGFAAPRLVQEIRLREDLPLAGDENEVIREDAVHRRGVVLRDSGLV